MSFANHASPVATSLRPSLVVIIGYYSVILLPILGYIWLANQQFVMKTTTSSWLHILTAIQLLILLFPFANSMIALLGLLWFGPPKDLRPDSDWSWNPDFTLIVAYVSRGHQPETLNRATSQTLAVLDTLGVAYALEVVTDTPITEDNQLRSTTGGTIYYFVVPPDYQTARHARYKARALQYLLEQRIKRLSNTTGTCNTWVLHMDEESIITPECVLGIHDHIHKYDLRSTRGAIGQGEILYNSLNYGDNIWTTAIDASRTGGDLGQFRMQYKALHKPLIGMHGSYVLTPEYVERDVTWDVGGHGSITEDAYFALLAMERGVKFDWVEGFIREQSPFTAIDIIRQRRRWYCGLAQVSRDPALKLLTRFTLRVFVWFWTFTALALPLPLIYLQQRFIFGSGVLPYEVFLMGGTVTGFYAAVYSVGAYRNVLHCDLPLIKKVWIVCFSLISWFFFVPALVECAGTLYGLFSPVSTFYVVAKDSRRQQDGTTP